MGLAYQCGIACHDERLPLCEMPYAFSDSEVSTTPAARPSQLACPDGWTNWDRFCFQFVDAPLKAMASHLYCTAENSREVIITSKEEENFIASWLVSKGINTTATIWLGLQCDALQGCQWTDQSTPFNYSNWQATPQFLTMHVFAAFTLSSM